MEKIRVPKGRNYWVLTFYRGEVGALETRDLDLYNDRENFKSGNYFLSKEDVLSAIHKMNAVLKGADVIEMPGDEEIEANADKQIYNYCPMPDGVDYKGGFWDAINYLKLKIVK